MKKPAFVHGHGHENTCIDVFFMAMAMKNMHLFIAMVMKKHALILSWPWPLKNIHFFMAMAMNQHVLIVSWPWP